MKFFSFMIVALGLAARIGGAELLKVGDSMPAISAQDQHGNPWKFETNVQTVLISFDMSDGKAANKVLAEKGAGFLPERKAVFVSNIFGMPGIGRVFALPKMRKYPHQIILADSEKLLDPFPKKENRVTVLALDSSGKISEIRYWDAEKEPIEAALKSAK